MANNYKYYKFGHNPTVYQWEKAKKRLSPFVGAWTPEAWQHQTGFKNWGGISQLAGVTPKAFLRGTPGAVMGAGIGVPTVPTPTTPPAYTPPPGVERIPTPEAISRYDVTHKEPGVGLWGKLKPTLSREQISSIYQKYFGRPASEEEIKHHIEKRTPEIMLKRWAEAHPGAKRFKETGEVITPEGKIQPPTGGFQESYQRFYKQHFAPMLEKVKAGTKAIGEAYDALPSQAELLKSARAARGLDEGMADISRMDTQLNTLEETMKRMEDDLKKQYGGNLTENQFQRILASEMKPIRAQYTDLLSARNTFASSLEREETVAEKEARMAYDTALMGIKKAEAEYGGLKDIWSLMKTGLLPEYEARGADIEMRMKLEEEGRKSIAELRKAYPDVVFKEGMTEKEKAARVQKSKYFKKETYIKPIKSVTEEAYEPFTQSQLNKLIASGIPKDVAIGINQDLLAGYSYDEIQTNLEMLGYENAADKIATYKRIVAGTKREGEEPWIE